VPTKKGKALKTGEKPRAFLVLPAGRGASAASDRSVRLWDLAKAKELAVVELESPVAHLAMAGRRLVGVSDDGELIARRV
jgi:hypothetical protein